MYLENVVFLKWVNPIPLRCPEILFNEVGRFVLESKFDSPEFNAGPRVLLQLSFSYLNDPSPHQNYHKRTSFMVKIAASTAETVGQ